MRRLSEILDAKKVGDVEHERQAPHKALESHGELVNIKALRGIEVEEAKNVATLVVGAHRPGEEHSRRAHVQEIHFRLVEPTPGDL